ncbi:unnamed protein product [Peniophora sp. CBMAI 1063]|nr:unnamed protein product [Peniophora sp. CBMAI 1063]
MAQPDTERMSQLSQRQRQILARLYHLLDHHTVAGPEFAQALSALFCADENFRKGKQVECRSRLGYAKLYPKILRQHFFPNAVIDVNGVQDLGRYDVSAEAVKRMVKLPLSVLNMELQFICVHSAKQNPSVPCGHMCRRLQSLFNHMDTHFGQGQASVTQKREYAEITMSAFFNDITTSKALLKRQKACSQRGLPMPDLLFFRDIRPIGDLVKTKVNEVLSRLPTPNPASGAPILTPAGPPPNLPLVFGSGVADNFTFEPQPAAAPPTYPVFAPNAQKPPRSIDYYGLVPGPVQNNAPMAGPSTFAPAPQTSFYSASSAASGPRSLQVVDDEWVKTAKAVCEGAEEDEGILKQSGKAPKGQGNGRSRTIASTPYGRPTPRKGETSASATSGSWHIRSSSVASNASNSSAASAETVSSSASGYDTSGSFTSNLSLPSSSEPCPESQKEILDWMDNQPSFEWPW